MSEQDRWGVWCELVKHNSSHVCGEPQRSDWASGPDGELVLYESVAKHLAVLDRKQDEKLDELSIKDIQRQLAALEE